jgi:predicted ATPase
MALYEHIRTGLFPEEETKRQADKGTSRREESRHGSVKATIAHPPASFPALALPAQLTSFVGRQREVGEIVAQLQKADVRLLTLAGQGGMGKTRLAIEVARTIAGIGLGISDSTNEPETADNPKSKIQNPKFPDGIFFVGLAALSSPAALAPTIAAALALPLSEGDPEQVLLNFLQMRRLLLILDNVEHLLEGVPLIVKILQSAPDVQLLTTSRAQLNVQGEQLYFVQEMDYSAEATLAEATQSSAVSLFVQRAQRAQVDFHLHEDNLPYVLHICRLVQGMPLGLELAAAWVGMLSLAEIVAEIEKSADFLAVDWGNVPDRQRSMRAIFQWSWHLLTATEQQTFRQLALFRGGFTREAAVQVTGATLRTLAELVHKSLIKRVESKILSGTRYEIHELLRQFAAEHLARISAEHEQVAARHSAFYLDYVAEREARLVRTEPREAAAEIQVEIDNIRQAWRCAVQRLDFPALHRSAWAFYSFYHHTGSSSEALQAFQLIADRLPVLARPALTLDQRQPQNLSLVSRLVAIHAYLLAQQNKVDQAIVVAQHALELVEAEGATDAAALSHMSWGQALRLQGRQADAKHHFEQTLQLACTVQDDTVKSELLYDVECSVTIWLGGFAADRGNNHEAREQMGRSLQLAQTLGKRRMQIVSLINMADIARNMGAYPSAQQEYEDALRLTQQIGFRWGEGASQLELGDVVRMQGEYSRAATLMESAFTILQEIGDHGKTALALTWLGRLYAYMGDTIAAEAWLTRYQQVTEQVKGWESEIDHLQARTVLALQRGELTQALTYATQGWQIGQTRSLPDVQAYTLIGMGHTQTQLGQLTAAKSAYQQAFELYTAIGRPDMAAEAQAGLAAIAQQQGDHEQALSLVEALLAQLAEQPTAGQDEPFFLYLTCYQVLATTQDRRAPAILQQGYMLLQRYAEQITDVALRQSFLENVPVHQALSQAYTNALCPL